MPTEVTELNTALKSGRCAKSTWSDVEDKLLFEIVNTHGPKNWPQIAQYLPGRSGKQCRERFKNHLDPSVKKEPFSHDEDIQIIRMVEELGPKWAVLASRMPGRTDNAIKNRYNSSLRRGHDEGKYKDLLVDIVPCTPPGSPDIQSLKSSAMHVSCLAGLPASARLSHARTSPKRKRSLLTSEDSDLSAEESPMENDSPLSMSRSSSTNSLTSTSMIIPPKPVRVKRQQISPAAFSSDVSQNHTPLHRRLIEHQLHQQQQQQLLRVSTQTQDISVDETDILLAAKLLCALRATCDAPMNPCA